MIVPPAGQAAAYRKLGRPVAARRTRGVGPFDRRGSFPAGVANEGLSSLDQVQSPLRYKHLWDNCRGYTFPREGIAINRISIERVDFVDGTSWLVPAASPFPAAATWLCAHERCTQT